MRLAAFDETHRSRPIAASYSSRSEDKYRKWLTAVLVVLGFGCLTYGMWIPAKAVLAQILLQRAWKQTLAGNRQVKPWPWADTWPVARLEVPSKHRSVIVLAGASGRTLAFGPGHLDGTPLPQQNGNCVISAHRDTHFSVLKELAAGDELRVQSVNGDISLYRVTDLLVVDRLDTSVLNDDGRDLLTLITCYPFDAIVPGGPQRYVVVAEKQSMRP